MLAYMPCPGLKGTSYIVKAVSEHFENCWPLALWRFVMDPKQRWCQYSSESCDGALGNETRINCLHFGVHFGPQELIESSKTRGAPSAEARFAINNFTR